MDRDALLRPRAQARRQPVVYWIARAILQPFFHVCFRMSRIGREHIPAEGPVIFASNHRSFLDPFVIGMMARRPIYFVPRRSSSPPAGRLVPQLASARSRSTAATATRTRWPPRARSSSAATAS